MRSTNKENNMVSKDTIKALKAASREIHKGMPRGGRQGTKKGKRGYTRKLKHKGGNNDD